jgi:hypothetical protein
MREFARMLILSALAAGSPAWAQSSQIPTPQTARQALLEMFSIKGSGTFVKHLPAATLSALAKSGAMQTLQQYSVLASQLHPSGNQNQMETFETGPVLLATYDPTTHQKVEVVVEKDSLQGDEDKIELSFRTYKDKQLQRTPFMPRVWTLNEILFSVRLPLADPDFLKSVTDNIKPRTAATTPIQLQSQPSTITFGNDPLIVVAMRNILLAENTYRNTYPAVGYTCTLSDLDGFGGGEANEHQAMLIASGLASGKKYGYLYTLSGCVGTPTTSLHLAAAPAANSVGRRAFCADQSGAIRYSSDGNPDTCFATGTPVQ